MNLTDLSISDLLVLINESDIKVSRSAYKSYNNSDPEQKELAKKEVERYKAARSELQEELDRRIDKYVL